MVVIEVRVDAVAAKGLVDRLSNGDVAFASAIAMNKTMELAQAAVRREAYAKAFTQRNKALPKALTMIPNAERANKRKLSVRMVNVRDSRTGRMAGEGFIERQIEGGRKVARGGNIAIPVIGKGLRRVAGGSIPKGLKPTANKKLFKVGNKLVERQRKRLITRFILQPTAKPSSKGRFEYLTIGEKAITDNIVRLWSREIRSMIARNSLTGRGMGLPRRGRSIP